MSVADRKRAGCDAKSALSFASMLRELFGLGCIGFGGGSALIPVFKERLVDAGKIDKRHFDDAIAVACITPGALPVELASGIGLRARGALGALAAAASFAAPGVALLVAVLLALRSASDEIMTQVMFLAVGVCGYILSVVARYIIGSISQAATQRGRIASLALVLAVFAVTCEKSLYKLFGAEGATPLFAIGTVPVIVLAFFEAIWIGPKRTRGRILTGVLMAAAYCFAQGELVAESSAEPYLTTIVCLVMLAMAAVSLKRDKEAHCPELRFEKPGRFLASTCVFAAPALLSVALAALMCPDAASYAVQGAASSILSFGGGDAYVAMADGMFVESAMVSQDDFYGTVVPVANALPGSILCKVLAGCGFMIGAKASTGAFAALAMCLAGFIVAISMSCITFAAGSYLIGALEKLSAYAALRRIIGCVVSGLLATVALGLLQTGASAAAATALSPIAAIATPIIIAIANLYAKKRFGVPALAAVILSAAASAVVFNIAM